MFIEQATGVVKLMQKLWNKLDRFINDKILFVTLKGIALKVSKLL
jgi:hypothetical protein